MDGGLSQWLTGVNRWRRDLQTELVALPETLRQFREGVANFQTVTKRLVDATAGLEALVVPTEALRQLEEMARALQHQAAHAPGADLIGSAVEEFSRALSAVVEHNPLFRRPPPA
jgi:hypothetical protein